MAEVAPRPSIFASKAFRQYFAGQSLSLLGDGLRLLAIPLLAFHLTHSALSTGGAFIAEIVPFSLFALAGGSLADRIDRRKLMIASDAIRCAVMTFFAVAFWLHVLTLPMIYAGLVVISICAAAFLGGQSSAIVYMLGRERSTEAMGVLIASENISNLIAPVVGGAIFTLFGPLPALILNALTYLASQLSLAQIPSLGPDRRTGLPSFRHLFDDSVLGFGYIWNDAGMRAQAVMSWSFNTVGFGSYAILIPFLKKGFGASDHVVGIFFGISAAGAVAGAWLAGRWSERWPFGRALTTAYLLDAALFLPVVLLDNLWLVAIFWAASNMLANFEVAQIIGFRMRITPEHMIGRVMGAVRLFVLSGIAPSVLIFGWMADRYSPHAAMWLGCIGCVVCSIAALLTPALRNETR